MSIALGFDMLFGEFILFFAVSISCTASFRLHAFRVGAENLNSEQKLNITPMDPRKTFLVDRIFSALGVYERGGQFSLGRSELEAALGVARGCFC